MFVCVRASLITYIMLKKKSYIVICQGKNSLLQRFGKKIRTQTKSPKAPSPTNRGSGVSEETLGTFCILWSTKSTFLKGNFYIYKGFIDVFYILTSVWKKNHKMCIWNWFFAMCTAGLTCVNGSTIQLVLRVYLFRNF